MNKLTINRDSFVLSEINLGQGTMTIGRAADNDIHLDDSSVSGHHAKIVSIFTATHVEDLGSTNGTFVNGHRIVEHTLHSGDIISIGCHQILFQSDHQMREKQADETRMMSAEKLQDMVEQAKLKKQMEEKQPHTGISSGKERAPVSFVQDIHPTEIDMVDNASTDQRPPPAKVSRTRLLKNIELEQQSVNEIRSRLESRKGNMQSRYATLLAVIGAVIVIAMLVVVLMQGR